MSRTVITVTNVSRNSTAGSSFLYNSFGGVFVKESTLACDTGDGVTGVGGMIFTGMGDGMSFFSGVSDD